MGLLQQARLKLLQRDWESMARSDPMWAVASAADRRKVDDNPWTADDFYDSGRQETERFITEWGIQPPPGVRVLEVGCGLGRMTATLRRLGPVYAVDFSQEMLAEARKALADDTITWVKSTGVAFPDVPTASCDLAFSYICFQHMEPWMQRENLLEVARCLRPGGRAYLHIPAGGTAAHNARPGRRLFRALQALGLARDPIANASGTNPMLMTEASERQVMAWGLEGRLWCRLIRYIDVEHTYAFYDFQKLP